MTEELPISDTNTNNLSPDNNSIDLPKIEFDTLKKAETHRREFSDSFIDLVLGEDIFFLKNYLDKVPPTIDDQQVIKSPIDIAKLYAETTQMLLRNLHISLLKHTDPKENFRYKRLLRDAQQEFTERINSQIDPVSREIVDWCEDNKSRVFPVEAIEYHGFIIDEKDILDSQDNGNNILRPNIRIQRQIAGTFIMAYTDKRVQEKLIHKSEKLNRRIYLNPKAISTPGIFEQILQIANRDNLSIQLKMFQRTSEFASVHKDSRDLRGDGIVIYIGDTEADKLISIILNIAKNNPEAFIGRRISRVPQPIAEGIGIGDDPKESNQSLTSHRAILLAQVIDSVLRSGKTGMEARELFRNTYSTIAKNNGVNPNNLAFNI